MKCIVKKATVEHAEEISKLHFIGWKETYKEIIPGKYLNNITENQWEKSIKNGLLDKEMKSWIATVNGDIIGCVCIGKRRERTANNELELISIYIHPKYIRRGVGLKLLNVVDCYAIENNFDKIGLWVFEENFQAKKFYEKNNYKENGEVKNIEIEGVSLKEIRYQKMLND